MEAKVDVTKQKKAKERDKMRKKVEGKRRLFVYATFIQIFLSLSFSACRSQKKEALVSIDASLHELPTLVHDASIRDEKQDASQKDSSSPFQADRSAFKSSSVCSLDYGPVELDFRGSSQLVWLQGKVFALWNENGRPRYSLVWPNAMLSKKISLSESRPLSSFPPCLIPPLKIERSGARLRQKGTAQYVYCSNDEGDIYRYEIEKDQDPHFGKKIAKSLINSRFSVALFAQDHVALAYLSERETPINGKIREAYLVVDDAAPLRLSENGSGASSVHLVSDDPRSQVVVVYADARAAMTPIHGRRLSFLDGSLHLGEDAVLSVADSDTSSNVVGVVLSGRAWGLTVLDNHDENITRFGMVAFPIDDPPGVDVSGTWSFYPKKMDPPLFTIAPPHNVGTTTPDTKRTKRHLEGATRLEGKGPASTASSTSAYVLRLHTESGENSVEDEVLELGQINSSGQYRSLGVVDANKEVRTMSMIEDPLGGVVMVYGNKTRVWLQRRLCH